MDNNAKQEAMKHMNPSEREVFLLTDRVNELEIANKELQKALALFLTREEFNNYREKAREDFAFKNNKPIKTSWLPALLSKFSRPKNV